MFFLFAPQNLLADTLTVEMNFDFRAPTGNPSRVETRFKVRLVCPTTPGADIRMTVEGEEGEAEKFCMAGAEKELVLREFVLFRKTLGQYVAGQILRGVEIIEINAREDCAAETLGPAPGVSGNPQNGRWICIQWLIMPCRGNEVKVLLQGRQMPRVDNIQLRICPPPLRALCDAGDFPIVINELMANNASTVADPQGDFDGWIELYNTREDSFDLSGMYLSNDSAVPRKWRIPGGTLIPGNGHLIFWGDGDSLDTPGLHTSFTLSETGGHILFLDADTGAAVAWDSLMYSAQTADFSFGRKTDGDTTFAVLTTPSPGRANGKVTSVRTDAVEVPMVPELAPNYPNPFNPSTRIRYSLPTASKVELAIFNLAGQVVKTLISAQQTRGIYQVEWNGRDRLGRLVPSGVYFYRLKAGRHVRARQMVRVE